MIDIAAAFFLVAIVHGAGDAFTITKLGTFASEAACDEASTAVHAAVSKGLSTDAEVACIPAAAIEAMKD